jgi:hypothetical protein
MLSHAYRNKNVGWVAGTALLAIVVGGVTGCSKDSDSDSGVKAKPAARSSSAADANKGKESVGSATSQPSSGRQSTPEAAVAAWVTAVVKGQPKEACVVMGEPATGSSPARANTKELCNGDTPEAHKMQNNIKSIGTSFTPKPPTDDPKVQVAQVPVNGDKAEVPADKVTVDGQTLDKIILSHSTGVESGQLDVRIESTKISGAWYVTNFKMHIG